MKLFLETHTRDDEKTTGKWTDGKIYKCKVCNASFIYLTSFKNHKRIDTREHPYKYDICDSS